MQIELIHWTFKKKLDKVASGEYRDFTQAEIDSFLNEAINIFVETRFTGNNFKQTSVESDQQRIDELSALIVKAPFTQPMLTPYSSNTDFGIYEFRLEDLSSDYRHYLSSKTKVTDCATLFDVKIVSHNQINKFLIDSTWKPSAKWLRTLGTFGESTSSNASSIFIYTDAVFEIEGLYMDYLRNPVEVSIGGYTDINAVTKTKVECDLPAEYHEQIIDEAVKLATGVIENNLGYQIANNQLKTNN